jgi:hypothetical protein
MKLHECQHNLILSHISVLQVTLGFLLVICLDIIVSIVALISIWDSIKEARRTIFNPPPRTHRIRTIQKRFLYSPPRNLYDPVQLFTLRKYWENPADLTPSIKANKISFDKPKVSISRRLLSIPNPR